MDIFAPMIKEEGLNFKNFPTTRYQGSKRKILPWIYKCIKEIEFHTIIDAFGGSASFSYLAKAMGKGVIYNDLLKFNFLIGKSVIENNNVLVNNTELDYIFNNKTSENQYNFIQNNFRDVYFLDEENVWLDQAIQNIYTLNGPANEIDYKRAILFNALFQSCLAKRPFNLFHRKNLYIRTADVKRNFGNKTTWEKSFENHMVSFVQQINKAVFDNNQNCLAINKSVFELDMLEADCVYLDPPYFNSRGTNETSNYYRCYHFLEGISQYETWGELINIESVNKGFKKELSINHFNKVDVESSFEELFNIFRKKTILLSYKSGGVPSIQWLENVLKKMGKGIITKTIAHTYALNRDRKKGLPTVEALIIAK